MRRILLVLVIALFSLTLAGAAFADEEKTVEKNIAVAMTFTGNEAAIGVYVHAMMLVNSLRALGGEIELDGDRLILRLELGPEQLDALRKALAECEGGEGLAGVFGTKMMGHVGAAVFAPGPELRAQENRRIIVMHKGDDEGCERRSHERFLLGKKHKMPADGERRKIMIMQRGEPRSTESVFHGERGRDAQERIKSPQFNTNFGRVIVTCPKCGEDFEIDLPMPKMGMPMPPMPPVPPGEHPKMFIFRMQPDGEFAPPHPPMPDMEELRERMGPMMEEMERMHRERGDMERRLGEMERALHELRVDFNRRPAEQDREMWRAIEELHRVLEDRDRERDREFDELWRTLDELYEALEQLERELD